MRVQWQQAAVQPSDEILTSHGVPTRPDLLITRSHPAQIVQKRPDEALERCRADDAAARYARYRRIFWIQNYSNR